MRNTQNTASIEVTFDVPGARLLGQPWFWAMQKWPGVRNAWLEANVGAASGRLTVVASEGAIERVRAFCAKNGFGEVRADDHAE